MKHIAIILALLFSAGCANQKQETQIVTVYEKQKVIKAQKLSPITLEKAAYGSVVIDSVSYIIMKEKDFKNLILNLDLIETHIKKQKDIIDYYESVVE